MKKIHLLTLGAVLAAGLLSCTQKQDQTSDTVMAEIYDDSTTIIVSEDSAPVTPDSTSAPADSVK